MRIESQPDQAQAKIITKREEAGLMTLEEIRNIIKTRKKTFIA